MSKGKVGITKYGLDEAVTYDIITCRSYKTHQMLEYENALTFREILENAGYDFEEGGAIHIIAEDLFEGSVYAFGNHDDEWVYLVGTTVGYA